MDGSFVTSELALDLSAVARGTAKPPYNDPVAFFNATHMTTTITKLLDDVLGRLSGVKKSVNPILVFDVGFGGGKTHAMAALFYAVRDSKKAPVRRLLGDVSLPKDEPIVVTISGDEYGGRGVQRGENQFRTLWADLYWQLGEHKLAVANDNLKGIPDRQTLTKQLSGKPVLILLDELSKYLDFVKDDSNLLEKVKHFIHVLSLSVSESDRSVLVVSVAGDVYETAAQQVRRELGDAMNLLKRKMQAYEPVRSEDVPAVLRKRLFATANLDGASGVAEAYMELYKHIHAPDRFRRAELRKRIEETYPFHPELIDILYDRVSTIPDFQRTRGALRLLANALRKVWNDKEADAFLVQPYHMDLADTGVIYELTSRLKEEKFKNAIESDVYRHEGRKAKAQELDGEYATHFGAPLFRRACNTVYLYTLTGAKAEVRGVDADTLIAALGAPGHEDQAQWYRDRVLPDLERFWYVERIGDRFLFMKEAGPQKVIDQEADNVRTTQIKSCIEEKLGSLFTSEGPGYFYVEIFPENPGVLSDDPTLKVAVLDPMLNYSISSEDHVPSEVASFILHSNSHGDLRKYRNDTFLLAAREGGWDGLKRQASLLEAARAVAKEPDRYDIAEDKRKQVKEVQAKYEDAVYDAVRATFTYILYMTKTGRVEAKAFRPNGYANAKSGQDLLWHLLSDVLNRVKGDPLDPDYLKNEAWSTGTVETTTETVFRLIHSKPGVILPKDQSLFEKTIQQGVERGLWVLLQAGHVYTPEDLPHRIVISSDSQLLAPEEAGRRGIADPRGHKCPKCLNWPCTCGGMPPPPPPPPELRGLEHFEPLKPSSQLEELDRWIRRDGVESISDAEITLRGNSELLAQFRNLIRLTSTGERKLLPHVRVTVTGEEAGFRLNCEFEAEPTGLEKPAAKIIDDAARWALPDFRGTITLKADHLPVTELRGLLQSVKDTEDAKLELRLRKA